MESISEEYKILYSPWRHFNIVVLGLALARELQVEFKAQLCHEPCDHLSSPLLILVNFKKGVLVVPIISGYYGDSVKQHR